MATKIFVNLPVKDLNRSIDFFTKLGYTFNSKFSDENAACMVVSEEIYVMLITEPFYKRFTKKPVSDATQTSEVIVSFAVESRAQVDEQLTKAIAAGAPTPNESIEMEGMYARSFDDPDGHHWEVMHMDMSAVNQA